MSSQSVFTCHPLICMLPTMLKRLLISWLITSILGLGMALASGVHVEDSLNHSDNFFADKVLTLSNLDDGYDNTGDVYDNCHDVIHLLGLNVIYDFTPPAAIDAVNVAYTASFIPLPPGSLYRPPITL